jgi:hypothetical protein
MNCHVTLSNGLSAIRRKGKVPENVHGHHVTSDHTSARRPYSDTFCNRTKQFSGGYVTSASQIVHVSRCTAGNLNKYEGELASSDKKPSFVGIGQLLQML